MTRAWFFVIVCACGSPQQTASVEIAPLPSVTATAATATEIAVTPHALGQIDDARDPRLPRGRSRELVVTEASALEQLLASTTANSPDRPAILRRLAEVYVELRKGGLDTASAKAIEKYDKLLDEYPNAPKTDEALYYVALEREITRDATVARRRLFELVTKFPSSRFVPYAYFAFGEMFLDEGKKDPPKLDLAKQAYQAVMKFSSPITDAAGCRIVLVLTMQNDTAGAESMKQKIGHACGA